MALNAMKKYNLSLSQIHYQHYRVDKRKVKDGRIIIRTIIHNYFYLLSFLVECFKKHFPPEIANSPKQNLGYLRHSISKVI